VVLCISLLLLVLACSSLDLFTSQALTKIQTIASKFGGSGFRGAFVMGAASGIVAAPCVGPVLVLILGVAASQGNSLWGAALLFSYSLGFGSLFLLIGAFPGLLQRLPRSGNWLFWVKFLIATALLLALLFIAKRYTLDLLVGVIVDVNILAVLAILLTFSFLIVSWRSNLKILRLPAALCLALAISPYTLIESPKLKTDLHWHPTIELALQSQPAAHSEMQVHTIVDFAADWCAACKELEAVTFSHPDIAKRLMRARLARIDFTEPDDALAERYNIQGLPAVLFLDALGNEIQGSRVSGFMSPQEFGEHLSKLGM
jgi:thiol:disulfide interchange protein DsbD